MNRPDERPESRWRLFYLHNARMRHSGDIDSAQSPGHQTIPAIGQAAPATLATQSGKHDIGRPACNRPTPD